jgi:hypothetical protein
LATFVSADSSKSGNPYFLFSKTNSASHPENIFCGNNADSTGQNASRRKTILLTKVVLNFKSESSN